MIRQIAFFSMVFFVSFCKPTSLESPLSDSYGLSGLEYDLMRVDLRDPKTVGLVQQEALEKFIRGNLLYKRNEGSRKERSKVAALLKKPKYISEIAEFIIYISDVMQIDPFFYTGLIAHESWFIQTNCYSGGCGLTQMTAPGVREVNDHLSGRRITTKSGKRRSVHSDGAEKYLKEKLVEIEKKYPGTFVRVSLTNERSLRSRHQREIKIHKKSNLVYGAMLLKIYMVAELKKLTKGSAEEYLQEPRNVRRMFKRTAARYNGHEVNRYCYPSVVGQQMRKVYGYHGIPFELKEFETKDDLNARRRAVVKYNKKHKHKISQRKRCKTAKFPEKYFGPASVTQEPTPPVPKVPKQSACSLVQLYAFSLEANALTFKDEIMEDSSFDGMDVFVHAKGDKVPYKVLVGPFNDAIDAALRATDIKQRTEYNGAFVVGVKDAPEICSAGDEDE